MLQSSPHTLLLMATLCPPLHPPPACAHRLSNLQGCLPLLPNLVTLDLSENNLTDLKEVLMVCSRMRYLKNLELMGAARALSSRAPQSLSAPRLIRAYAG